MLARLTMHLVSIAGRYAQLTVSVLAQSARQFLQVRGTVDFIDDFPPHQTLDNVLEGDDAVDTAVFIDYQHHVRILGQQFFKSPQQIDRADQRR